MERPFRREVTSPAPLSCARWKERVVGGTPTRWLISPAARPAGPRRTRRRNTFSRDSWASAPRAVTARFSSIILIYWNYGYLSRVVVVLVGIVVRVVALPALPRRRIVLLARLGITGHRRASSSWAYHGRPPPQERAQRGPRPHVAGEVEAQDHARGADAGGQQQQAGRQRREAQGEHGGDGERVHGMAGREGERVGGMHMEEGMRGDVARPSPPAAPLDRHEHGARQQRRRGARRRP